MKKTLYFSFLTLLLAACQPNEQSNLKETDLLSHGLAVTIMAPDSATIKADNLGGIYKDITVKGGDNYYVQILASEAETSDLAKVKANQLAEVKGNRYFSKIVSEQEDGFIYQTAVDSNNINYGFRYILLQGDQEIVFQTGLIGTYSLEEVERMYEAVRQE